MLTGRYLLSALHGWRSFFSFSWQALPDSSVEFCRAHLLENDGCCLDEQCDPSVVQRNVRRPGASWECIAAQGCLSEPGFRGDDMLSIPADPVCDCRILFLHGGSWYHGSPNSTGYAALASKLAARTRCVVMMPDFALLPVGNFDSMLKASVEALQWLGNHVLEECEAKPPVRLYVAWHRKLANFPEKQSQSKSAFQKTSRLEACLCEVGGDSSGATTALSLILHLGQQPDLIPRACQLEGGFLWSPWTNLCLGSKKVCRPHPPTLLRQDCQPLSAALSEAEAV